MTKRKVILAVIGLIALGIAAKWRYESWRLSKYRRQIEADYGSAIALIENSSRRLPSRDDISIDTWEKRQSIMADIEQALSATEIVEAAWTLDGHHLPETLRPWNTPGYSISSLYRESDATRRHTVRYGKTFDGKRLIIFEGFVPDGAKRYYCIAFLADGLNQRWP